ncbi:MAG: hypothetical protein ACKPKO_63590, partial [Candidatus Fonsibacter sp.]
QQSKTYQVTSTIKQALSSMTPEQLHNNCVQIGLANMSWDDFVGLSYIMLWCKEWRIPTPPINPL